MLIDGQKIAETILSDLSRKPTPEKILAGVVVGDNESSLSFLRQKEKIGKQLGVSFKLHRFSDTITQKELIDEIRKLNNDKTIGGIILQLPLPKTINRDVIVNELNELKDVDALKNSRYVFPPAVAVVDRILKDINYILSEKNVLVVGRGFLIGAPIAEWLKPRVKSLTVFHRSFFNETTLKNADVVISGIGSPNFIKGEWIKQGAVLIDFGYGRTEGKLTGDIDFKSCEEKAAYLTPTPGGAGPILVASLYKNFYSLLEEQDKNN